MGNHGIFSLPEVAKRWTRWYDRKNAGFAGFLWQSLMGGQEMFCNKCGSQLPDGAKFCVNCGNFIEAMRAPGGFAPQPGGETTVLTPDMMPQPGGGETTVLTPDMMPQPGGETTVLTPDMMPQPGGETTVLTPDMMPQPGGETTVLTPDMKPDGAAPAQSQWQSFAQTPPGAVAAAPAQPQKKKGKKGLILGIVAAVLVVGIGVGGWFGYSAYRDNQAYEAALALVEAGEYDQALVAFGKILDVKDSRYQRDQLLDHQEQYDRAQRLLAQGSYEDALALLQQLPGYRDADAISANLQEMIATYDRAQALLAENRFDEAQTLLQGLGDFGNSRHQTQYEIPYAKAAYIMDQCLNGALIDAAAQYPELMDGNSDPEVLRIRLLEQAGNLFAQLPGYESADVNADTCYLEAAKLELSLGNREAAREYLGRLSDTNSQILENLLWESSTEKSFLNTVCTCLILEYMAEQEDTTQIPGTLQDAYTQISGYQSAAFEDSRMADLAAQLRDAMEVLQREYNGDRQQYYTACASRSQILDALQAEYAFLDGHDDLKAWFLNQHGYFTIRASVQEQIQLQLVTPDPVADESGIYYQFVSPLAHGFGLELSLELLLDGSLVTTTEAWQVEIGAGETVRIDLPFPESDGTWNQWRLRYRITSIN